MSKKLNLRPNMSSKVTIYFIPSPKPLDWTSPTSLARTILRNQIIRKNRFMGHVNVKLEHNNVEHFTGMTAIDIDSARKLLIKNKIGLGIIYHSFAGRLETKEELDIELSEYLKIGNKRINFIQYDISSSMGDRIQNYLRIFKEKNLDNYYGLVNSPLHGEGSGCSAFGASIVSIMDEIDEDIINSWSNNVRVPTSLTGAPVTDNKVNFFKLLLKNLPWANIDDDHKELFFWDPDLMWSWVERNLNSEKFKTIKIDNTYGIKKDISNKEAAEKPIFRVQDVVSILPDLQKSSNLEKYRE